MGRFLDGQASLHGIPGDEAKRALSALSLYFWAPGACTLASSKLGIIFRVGDHLQAWGHSTVGSGTDFGFKQCTGAPDDAKSVLGAVIFPAFQIPVVVQMEEKQRDFTTGEEKREIDI